MNLQKKTLQLLTLESNFMKTILIGIIIIAFCFLYSTYIEKNFFVAMLFIGGFAIFIFGALKLLDKLLEDEKD